MTEKKTGSAQVKESPLANVQLHLVDSLEEALSLKRWLGERRETPLGVDTESEGLDPFRHDLRLVQVGDMRQGWALPWPLWGGLAQEVLNTYEGEFVAHNASFDSRMLLKRGNIAVPWHRLHDTMTLATLDDPTRLRGLKPLSSMLIDKNATSGERALSEGMRNNGWGWDTVPYDFPAYWAYGALDPVLTCHLFNHLFPRVNGDCPEVYSLERGVTRVCSNMMLKGIRVDRQYIQDNIVRLKDVSRQSREWLDSVHGIKNPLSSRQISAALEKCGYEVTETTRTGLPKTDKETLTSIRDGQAVPEAAATVARYILGVRHIDKVIGSYLENFLITADSDDVIHPSIHPLAARTSRMSITDPALQTLHRDDKIVRGSFIPREGNVFISCDADQIELRVAAILSNDAGLIEAFHEADKPGGLDFFSSIASQLFNDKVRKGDNRRQVTKNMSYCVPVSTKILTSRGWLCHDEVKIGDVTIGFDFETQTSRWTKITHVHHFDDLPIIKMGNAYHQFLSTKDHRWVVRRRRPDRILFRTTEQIASEDKIILAAPLEDDSGTVFLDDTEAAVLAWLFSDGDLSVEHETRGPSQAGGSKREVRGRIRQSEKKYANHIRSILCSVPHREYIISSRPGYVQWGIDPEWLRPIIQRLGMYDAPISSAELAAKISAKSRKIMLREMRLADGEKRFAKAHPWKLDFYTSLVYMDGHVPTLNWCAPQEGMWQKKPIAKVSVSKPTMTGIRILKEDVGNQPAWCVTTELGTWTIRNGDHIGLTGNCYIYGGGLEKMALTAGVSVEQMKPIREAFMKRFPGLDSLARDTERQARAALSSTGRPSIKTPTGRRLPVDESRIYAGLNFRIQGHAAELLKKGILGLDAAGLGDNLLIPVHDEIVLEAPQEDAEDVLRLVEETLTNRTDYSVPLTWGGAIMKERWVKSD